MQNIFRYILGVVRHSLDATIELIRIQEIKSDTLEITF